MALAYAFLRYIEKYTTREVLAAILLQIARSDEGAFSHLQALHQSCKQKGEESLTEMELASALHIMALGLKKLYLVIDGLDEAMDSTKEGLLRALTSLPEVDVNILIMSRPLPHLVQAYTPQALDVSIQALNDDVETYVRERAQQSARVRAIVRDDEDALQQLCIRVKAQSDGM